MIAGAVHPFYKTTKRYLRNPASQRTVKQDKNIGFFKGMNIINQFANADGADDL